MKRHQDQLWFGSGQMKEFLCHHFQHGKLSSKIDVGCHLAQQGDKTVKETVYPYLFPLILLTLCFALLKALNSFSFRKKEYLTRIKHYSV